MSSKTCAARSKSLSLLDLPQSILEDIIGCVRQMTRWDGYLSDLRLVNSRFNEAILHVLTFRCSPRPFHDEHYMSCPGRCFTTACCKSTRCNSTYARYYLQSKISTKRESDAELLRFYQNLSESLVLLDQTLNQQENPLTITQKQIEDSSLFRSGSVNPIFTNKWSHALCEAVITYLELCLGWSTNTHWIFSSWDKRTVSQRGPLFWIQCLACYFADFELLKWSTDAIEPLNGNADSSATQCGELLGVLASRSHLAMCESFLKKVPKDTDMGFALWGACFSGSKDIAVLILQTIPSGQRATLSQRTLLGMSNAKCVPRGYVDVAEQILVHCGMMSHEDVANMLSTQARLGTSRIIQILLGRYAGRRLWPMDHYLIWQQTPIFAACVNRDVSLLKQVVEWGYLAGTRNLQSIQDLYSNCERAAARANSLPILQQLCYYQKKELHEVSLHLLAAIDGSIPAMTTRLEVKVGATQHDMRSNTSFALRHAIERLRVENARFLLARGIQLNVEKDFPRRIEWRYRRAHENEFQEMRELLTSYELGHVFKVTLI